MRFITTLALLSFTAAFSVDINAEDENTDEGGEFDFVQDEVLGGPEPYQKPTYDPGKYIIEFAPGGDQETSLWDDLEFEGYNFTLGQFYETENSTFVPLEVTNFDDNQNSNFSVLNLVEGANGVIDVQREEKFYNGFSFVSRLGPTWDPHAITGVEKLHAKGIKGKGVTVAIIDSGINTSHEVFKGKTIKGYNYLNVGKEKDISDLHGHGTFVASIFGGESSKMVGVAPEATIRMYRVLNDKKQGQDLAVKRAVLQAETDKVDLISISIGRDMASYLSDDLATTLNRVAKKIPVVVAAGNAGFMGTFQAANEGTYDNVISVGSIEATTLVTWPMTLTSSTGETFQFEYVSSGSVFSDSGTFDAEFVSDLCDNPGPVNKGKVLFGYAFTCQPSDLAGKNPLVKAFLSFDSAPNYQAGTRKYGLTTHDVGNWLKRKLDAGEKVTVTMNLNDSPTISQRKVSMAGKMAVRSTWGPTYTNGFYPSISGPGGNVFGADSKQTSSYYISSGTSYACPYVAGVIALYLSQHPKAPVDQVRKRLLSTASLLPLYNNDKVNTKFKEPVIHQGAGLVDAWKFLFSDIELTSDPLLAWGDNRHRKTGGTIKWKNTGKKTRSYKLTHGTTLAVRSRSAINSPSILFPETSANYARLLVHDANEVVTVGPGQIGQFGFTIVGPKGLDATKFTTWQGYIRIKDNLNLSITVPYMGVEGNTFSWNPIHSKPVYSPLLLATSFVEGKWPTVSYTMDYGTEEYSFDLVSVNFDAKNFNGDWKTTKGFLGTLKGTDNGMKIDLTFIRPPFGPSTVAITGRSSGKKVAAGSYRILMRALRTYGVRNKLSDWQYYLSDTINIQKASLNLADGGSSTSSSSSTSSTSSDTTSDSSTLFDKWSNSSISSSTNWYTPPDVSPETSIEVPGVKSSTTVEEVTITKPCTSGCTEPKDKATVTKLCTSGCTEPNDKVTVSKSCTIGCNEPKDKVTVTTITKCSYGGCEQIPVTIGETKTVKVTVTSCSNNVCATKVTLVAECVGTTSVGGKVEFYTSVSTIENTHSVSTFHNAASRTMGLMIILLLSFLAI